MAKHKRDGSDMFAGLFGKAEEFTPVNASGNQNDPPAPADEKEEVKVSSEVEKEPIDTPAVNAMKEDSKEEDSKEGDSKEGDSKEGDIVITYDDELGSQEGHIKDGIVSAKEKRETRSKTIQIKLQPSMYAEAKSRCEEIGISFNEGVNQLLKFWLDAQK